MSHYDARDYSPRRSVGYLIRRSASLMREELDRAFAGHDLGFVHWVTLILVRENPSLTAGDIGRDLHHDSGALTRVIDQLEELGLLRRERSETDRRVVRLHLTAAGRRMVDSLLPLVVDRLNDALRDFSAAEVATLVALLTRLIAGLEAARAAAPAHHGAGARTRRS